MKSLDKKITLAIHRSGKSFLPFWEFLSEYGLLAFVFFFLGLWVAAHWWSYALLMVAGATGVTFAVTYGLRLIFRRPRPDFMKTDYELLHVKVNEYSFPSLHAAISGSLATSVSLVVLEITTHQYALPSVIFLGVIAALVTISRIMVGVHYLSDILAGLAVGIGITLLIL
jgi:membrane-associated phospholipid phosphatase